MYQFLTESDLPAIGGSNDTKIWTADLTGNFTVANDVEQIRKKFPILDWAKYVWSPCIHPCTSCNLWKVLRVACVTEESVRKKGFNTVSKCYLCGNGQDNMQHILWECSFSTEIWRWIGGMFHISNPTKSYDVIKCVKHHSSAIRQIWYIVTFKIIVELWLTRNLKMHEDIIPKTDTFKHKIMSFTKKCEMRIKRTMKNRVSDLNIIMSFGIRGIKCKNSAINEVFFKLPALNQILISYDGASKGNPGIAGFGFMGRNSDGSCLGAVCGGLDIATNYIAEVMALVTAGQWAVRKQFMDVYFSLDSRAVLVPFSSGKVPWIVLNRWKKVTENLRSISFRHSYREINFSADKLAKHGVNLNRGEIRFYYRTTNFFRNNGM
ncbi:uncharacterized protein LOC113295785 [Papaver somniferum]|uniref:uncharacterized protein LOC113295785 n=1 Tax=Papaver somniferum TaxID=3469 RepID=UPI000E704869|nr:uncharacterized protein LOC113295785 [Papaver somniferum]